MQQNYPPCTNGAIPILFRWFLLCFALLSAHNLTAENTTETNHSTWAFTCNIDLQVALDPNCEDIVTAYDILEGETAGCCDNYLVELFYDEARTQAVPTSPMLTASEVGLDIYVILTDPVSGNNCDVTTLEVVDNLIPDLTCPVITMVTCTDATDPGTLGFPVGGGVTVIGTSQPYVLLNFDPCGPATLTFNDVEEDGVCGTDTYIRRIVRTWTAEDASGNTTTCDEVIEITRSTLLDVDFPDNLDGIANPHLACNDVDNDGITDDVDPDVLLDDNGHPHPDVTGYPSINGNPITDALACGFAITYADQPTAICNGSTLYLRVWTVTAWCPTIDFILGSQIIKVIDDFAPVITCPADLTVSTSSNDCTASVILPVPTITDDCSGTATYTISPSQGTLLNNTLFNIPLGNTTVTYTATDDCGNTADCSFTISVEDQVPPVTICETIHTVGITVNDPTLVNAIVFDDGSTDNCGNIVSYEVRRMDNPNCPGDDATPFGPSVPFYCCDVGGPNVMVELRITDDAGNTNSCMVETIVQDNVNPAITCPTDKLLDCGGDTSPANTGMAVGSDNCSVIITSSDSGMLDDCGEGTIFRTWTATDAGGRTASCVQRIDVVNSAPYTITDTLCRSEPIGPFHSLSDGVEWPCNITLTSCDSGLSPDSLEANPLVDPLDARPQIFSDACDMIIPISDDDTLPILLPSCLKILRTWSVYNWCAPNPTVPVAQYTQVITVMNSTPPTITSACTDGEEFCSFDPNCATGAATLNLMATDDCTPAEDLEYSYTIDFDDNGGTDASGSTNDASGTYPIGTHRITWTVEDGCNNSTSCNYTFTIEDCQTPLAVALDGLSIGIDPVTLTASITAANYNASSSDNCGIADFRIAFPSGGPGQTVPPTSTVATFTCADLGAQVVDFWVIDDNGNFDYVSASIIINDGGGNCPNIDYAIVSGGVANEEGAEIPQVQVLVGGDNMNDEEMTDDNGDYSFDLPMHQNYTVSPEHNDYPLNGVSTYDLVLISQHILGIQTLESPYKMIAADVNNSGTISTLDVVKLRELILFIETEFENNTSWRFVDANYVFPNPGNPFETAFPEVYTINDLSSDEVANFVAVKIGDVNCSAVTNLTETADSRQVPEAWSLRINDQLLVKDEIYLLSFRASEASTLQGFQFALQFDPEALSFVGFETGQLASFSAQNLGDRLLDRGILTSSWNSVTPVSWSSNDEALFHLQFRAEQNGFIE